MKISNSSFCIFFKFMKSDHVASFVNDGLLFMNNIKYFKNLKDDNGVVGDRDEGLSAIFDSDSIELYIQNTKIKNMQGHIEVRFNDTEATNIYCGTLICASDLKPTNDGRFIFDDKFIYFGDKVAIIMGENVEIFLDRISDALSKEGINDYRMEKVKYLERLNHNGAINLHNKFSEYSWQYEWRLILNQNETDDAFKLKIGSLKDIVQVFDTKDLFDPNFFCYKFG